VNYFIILSMALLFCSCSTGIKKFGKEQYFKQKVINNIDASYHYEELRFFKTVKNDNESCFEDNSANNETLTLRADHLHYAIDHFYKRISKVNVKIVHDDGLRKTQIVATEQINFDLEIAYCKFDFIAKIPWNNSQAMYVSIRKAD
jgi:hypothetical protein